MADFPVWMQILRLLATLLLCTCLGVHAYASSKTHLLKARKWVFLLYSLVFLFTSLVTLAYLMVSIRMEGYSQGPVKLGLFNMLLIFSYLALSYGVGKRQSLWYVKGQDRII
jgi:hypothetical protein